MPTDEKTVAESSAATSGPFEEVSLDKLSDEQYSKWKLTGELPKNGTIAKPAASLPAKKTIETPDESGKSKGSQEAGKGKDVRTRKAEIDSEIQEFEASLARRNDLKRQLEEPKPGDKATAPPEQKTQTDLKAPEKPVRPKSDDFPTWDKFQEAVEKYETAKDEYFEKLSEYKVEKAIQEDRKQRTIESESATIANRWNKAVDVTAKEHGIEKWNEASKAIQPLLGKDPRMAAAAAFVVESELGPGITYYLGTHLDEANEIAAMPPIKQIRALTLIESSLTKPVKPESKETRPPGPKKETEATKPPTDLAARNASSKDPVEEALQSGDTDAYIRAANARDAAAKRRVLG